MRSSIVAVTLLLAMAGGAAAQALIDRGKEADVPVCGGFAGYICRTNQWCDFPQTAACGIGDQFGTCRQRPDVCTREYMPVCACNG